MVSDTPRKPVILTFVGIYLPGYKSGGPLRTIANIAEALGDEFDFRIVTADRDRGEVKPYANLDPDRIWISVGKANVRYLAPGERSLSAIGRILRETPHDVLYLNSFFDVDFTIKPLLARWLRLAPRTSCIVAPRGEFSPNALRIKAWKKTPFLWFAGLTNLYGGLMWQASSTHEAADIVRMRGMSAGPVHVAIDLPGGKAGALPAHRPRSNGEALRICFLSRISPMKNLDYALEVLQQVKTDVRFDIYGPIADAPYWTACQALKSRLPPRVSVAYRGCVEHAQVPSVLAQYDVFFLPTRGENFGHAIIEALAAGTPVLIADTTPWRDLEKSGVGWDFSLKQPEAFAGAIDSLSHMTSDELLHMRARATSFAENCKSDPAAVGASRDLFSAAITAA